MTRFTCPYCGYSVRTAVPVAKVSAVVHTCSAKRTRGRPTTVALVSAT